MKLRTQSGKAETAFTLIEISVVLVVIGLIVGGVLVGQDLIRAAGIRAQITQIEKYNSAVNTFRSKFNALPGDMDAHTAQQFGFTARGTVAGQGDGNGIIEGYCAGESNGGFWEAAGETVMFWVDLTTANGLSVNLIEGGFNTATVNNAPYSITQTGLDSYFPEAKLGLGNYIYVYSNNGVNYYGLSFIASVSYCRQIQASVAGANTALAVAQAYRIDSKVDDGYPQTGNVTAQYLTGGTPYIQWAQGTTGWGATPGAAATPSIHTCYDNGGNASATMVYSMSQANGAYPNCALSFKFQ